MANPNPSHSSKASRVAGFFTRPFFMAVYLWMALGLGGYFVLDLLVMPLIAGKFTETVAVPELSGLLPDEAALKLKNNGLQYMLDSTGDYSAEIGAGRILSQYPQSTTVVKEGRRVWVKVSKGARSRELPEMKGLSLRQAEITLQQLGLKLGQVSHIGHGSIPSGAVIGSQPATGTPLEQGRSVDIFISSGRSSSAESMPNLVGLSLDQARASVREAGLEVGKISYRREGRKLPETVLAHSPKAGQAMETRTVDLVVSQ